MGKSRHLTALFYFLSQIFEHLKICSSALTFYHKTAITKFRYFLFRLDDNYQYQIG